jgi:hypothetical protein
MFDEMSVSSQRTVDLHSVHHGCFIQAIGEEVVVLGQILPREVTSLGKDLNPSGLIKIGEDHWKESLVVSEFAYAEFLLSH